MDKDLEAAINRLADNNPEIEIIRRAMDGDVESAREILKSVALLIDARQFDSPLFDYLAECLLDYAEKDVPIEQAFHVKGKKRGRPPRNDVEIMAADIILRKHLVKKPGQAAGWFQLNGVSINQRDLQTVRKAHKPMEGLPLANLFILSGSLQAKLGSEIRKKKKTSKIHRN